MPRLPLVLCLLLLALMAPGAAARTSPQGGVAVVPADRSAFAAGQTLLIEDVRPGASVTTDVLVVNTADEAIRVAVYPADGTPTQQGGFSYGLRDAPRSGVGDWAQLAGRELGDNGELTVPANGRLPLVLRLIVDSGAYNGRNVGAVVVEPLEQESGEQLQTRTRYAMPITVVVEGGRPRPAGSAAVPVPQVGTPPTLQLRALEPRPRGDQLCPTVVVGNTGSGSGTAELRVESDGSLGASGTGTAAFEVPPPASTRQVQLPCVSRPLGLGQLDVRVEGQSERDGLGKSVFWAPWPFVLSILLLLLLIGALMRTFWVGWRRRRSRAEPDAERTSQQ